MKKSLVLAMAMALGVTASAYAANPFSDVPAGHWAYDSISKLAAAGVIEGYGDDTFRGDRLMTRYEMAQIVAKAMAKGANVDKLAAEFADELDALGVRVAALEKKADNVKITGAIRYHYTHGKVDDGVGSDKHVNHGLRTRLTFTGKVNDTWNYVGLLENRQMFHDHALPESNHVGEDGKVAWQRAYLQGRLGGVAVTAGRFSLGLGHSEDDIFSDRFDGIKVGYGDKVRFSAYYGKPSHYNWRETGGDDQGYKKGYGVGLEGDLGKYVTLWAGWDKFENNESVKPNRDDNAVWNVGAMFKFNKDLSLAGTYAKSNDDGAIKDNGFYLDLKYKGAVAAKPGSWGLQLKYYHWGDGVLLAGDHGWDNLWAPTAAADGGWKGFKFGGNYAVAKNMVAEVYYWDLKGLESDKKTKTIWTALNVSF